MHAANQIPTTVGFVIATPQSTIAQDSNLLAHAGQYSGGISVSLPVRFRQALSGLSGVIFLGVCQNAHASFSLTFQGLVRTRTPATSPSFLHQARLSILPATSSLRIQATTGSLKSTLRG